MNTVIYYCPQCGEKTERLHDGYCEQCCNENQAALDRHIFEQQYWERMDDERRRELIRNACS